MAPGGGTQVLKGYLSQIQARGGGHHGLGRSAPFMLVSGGQGGLVVKRPPGNQKVGGSNPTTVTW